jgi:hypothetical protein
VNGLAFRKEKAMKAQRVRSTVLIAASVLLAGIVGCVELSPSPEAVLEGTWEVVPAVSFDPQLAHLYVTFDSKGDLSQVSYTFADLTKVTWNYPPGSVSVDGDQVHLSVTSTGNGLNFFGTLDHATAPTRADGEVTVNLNIGDVHVSVSQGKASLIKR